MVVCSELWGCRYTDEVDRAATAEEKAWVKERPGAVFPLNIENMVRPARGPPVTRPATRSGADIRHGSWTRGDWARVRVWSGAGGWAARGGAWIWCVTDSVRAGKRTRIDSDRPG